MKVCPLCKTEYPGGEVFCPLDGARLVSPSSMHVETGAPGGDPLVGQVLGDRYKILKRIGEGGMGIVYEAMHIVIEKHVALKVLRDDFSSRPEVVERFRQEAKSASRIGHENIVDISDFGETPTKQSYFVMEMLEGEDLADVLAREGSLSPARATKILIQCCKALGAAHSKGIVHRDMKPENIFLVRKDDSKDFVKIVDFGIAKMSDIETQGAPGRKLTKTGMIFGTPEYMSPEQAAGKPLDHRVDVYALGVILFELLAGRVPFLGDTFMGVLTQHMFEPIPTIDSVNPHVTAPPELEAVVTRALSKDPDTRFQSMEEMGRAIAQAMDYSVPFPLTETTAPGFADPVRARAAKPRALSPDTTDMPVQRAGGRGALFAVVGVVALLVLGGGGWFAWHASQAGAGVPGALDAGVVTPVAFGPDLGTDEGSTIAAAPDLGAAVPGAPDAGAVVAVATTAVSVDTDPPGASVVVDGLGTVCAPTPCTFQAAPGATIQVHARKGRAQGSQTLTPSGETLAVHIALVAPHVGGGHPGGGDRDTGGGGELKIPDVFRHPH